MRGRQKRPDYLIRKDRRTGEWVVRWRMNDPIRHYSFDEARQTVIDLLRLEIHWKTTKRGHK